MVCGGGSARKLSPSRRNNGEVLLFGWRRLYQALGLVMSSCGQSHQRGNGNSVIGITSTNRAKHIRHRKANWDTRQVFCRGKRKVGIVFSAQEGGKRALIT